MFADQRHEDGNIGLNIGKRFQSGSGPSNVECDEKGAKLSSLDDVKKRFEDREFTDTTPRRVNWNNNVTIAADTMPCRRSTLRRSSTVSIPFNLLKSARGSVARRFMNLNTRKVSYTSTGSISL